VIRVSQWAEMRHLFLVEEVAKKEIARRIGVDVRTVRRALEHETPPKRATALRPSRLDPWRGEIERLLREEPRLTAKRIGRVLVPPIADVGARMVRKYVARVRRELFPREAFVHRTFVPGDTMEGDFGDSVAVIAGRVHRVKFLVATLPASNVYFARAYPVERLECLLDGLQAAFEYFGGVPRRAVLDNTSLAVKEVLRGSERVEHRAFQGFRGTYPFHVDFCAPRKGWEKGSVEGGVGYVRDNVFRPMPEVASFEELNALILRELERDLDERRLPDGRTVRQALCAEREHLRPLPTHRPEACRTVSCVASKFGLVRIERADYSVPIRWAYRPVLAKLFPDRVVLVVEGEVVASHGRTFCVGGKVIDPFHVLSLLEHKHRAVPEATAIQQLRLPPRFHELRAELRRHTRKADQEWVQVLRLLEEYPLEAVAQAIDEAWERGSPRRETIRLLLRRPNPAGLASVPPALVRRAELAQLTVAPPLLGEYDRLAEARS